MKSPTSRSSRSAGALLRPAVAAALARLAPPLPASIAEHERTHASGRAPLAADAGRFLEALAAARPGGTILELGAGERGATLWLARGARGGSLTAVARDGAEIARVRELVARAGSSPQPEWTVGEPREAIDGARMPIDLAVVDLGASESRRLVDLLLPKLAVGGAIAILGALRDRLGSAGELAEDEIAALERLRPYVLIHPQLAATLVPLGDGILFAVKRRETIRELGGPY